MLNIFYVHLNCGKSQQLLFLFITQPQKPVYFVLFVLRVNKSYGNKKVAYQQLHEPSFQMRYYTLEYVIEKLCPQK